MAYARGIYGVEYTPQPSRGNEGHPLRWLLLGVVVMVAVALFVAHSRRKPGPPVIVRDAPEAPVVATTDEKPPADRMAQVMTLVSILMTLGVGAWAAYGCLGCCARRKAER